MSSGQLTCGVCDFEYKEKDIQQIPPLVHPLSIPESCVFVVVSPNKKLDGIHLSGDGCLPSSRQVNVKFKGKDILNQWYYKRQPLTTSTIIDWANEWKIGRCIYCHHYSWEDSHWRCPACKYMPIFNNLDAGTSHILVDFKQSGSCKSEVGKDSITSDNQKATMVLNLSLGTGDDEKKRLVVHEFGHALGLLHEHQRKDFWKKAEKYLNEQKMKSDLGPNYEKQWATEIGKDGYCTEYDAKSVMHYSLVEWIKPNVMRNQKTDFLYEAEDVKLPSKKDLYGLHIFYNGNAALALPVMFRTLAGATRPYLCGSFNNWKNNEIPMVAESNGMYSVVLLLRPGNHEYKYYAEDTKWIHDQNEPTVYIGCFNTYNNVVNVTEKDVKCYIDRYFNSDEDSAKPKYLRPVHVTLLK